MSFSEWSWRGHNKVRGHENITSSSISIREERKALVRWQSHDFQEQRRPWEIEGQILALRVKNASVRIHITMLCGVLSDFYPSLSFFFRSRNENVTCLLSVFRGVVVKKNRLEVRWQREVSCLQPWANALSGDVHILTRVFSKTREAIRRLYEACVVFAAGEQHLRSRWGHTCTSWTVCSSPHPMRQVADRRDELGLIYKITSNTSPIKILEGVPLRPFL